MKVSGGNKPLQTITNKIKRGNIIFTHKLQRREGVWSKYQSSLLIDSLLRGYPVNPVYTVIDAKQAVIDGVQRLSSCYSYINDGFALSKNLDAITIGDKTYEIAGKKFSKLDDPIKDELMSAQIQVYEITEYTDKEIRTMFARLNGGKPLNTVQKLTPNMSDGLSSVMLDIISHPFFVKVFTPAQIKSSTDQATALEILMLSEISNEYDFGSFSKTDREKFIEYYNDKINYEKIDLIKQALDDLNEIFDDCVKVPKTSISVICYAAYRVKKDNKDFNKFIDVVKDFLLNYDSNEEYKSNLKEGTASTQAVKYRLDYWRKIVREL